MRIILGVLIISSLILQCIESRSSSEFLELENLIKLNEDSKSVASIWDNIKNTAKNGWNSIKNLAQNTKDKIKVWINKVKTRAHDISEKFQYRIKELKIQSKNILEKLVGTGKLFKECFESENEAVEKLLKQIITYVTCCLSDNLINLEHLEYQHLRIDINETNFIKIIEKKLNDCSIEKDVEGCLNKIRNDIYEDMDKIESEIMTNRTESRSIADDLLDSVLSCSLEGVIDASNVISTLIVNTIACVVKG